MQVDLGPLIKKEDKEMLLQEAIRLAWKVFITDGDVHVKAESLLSLTNALRGRSIYEKKKTC